MKEQKRMEKQSGSTCGGKWHSAGQSDREEWKTEIRAHTWAHSAVETVTVRIQSLHPHCVPTLSPVPEWDWGTSGSHNGDYLQPQWGNDTKMPLARKTEEMERWKEREQKREREKGFSGSDMKREQRGEEETWEWPPLYSDRGGTTGGGKLITPRKLLGSFPLLSKPLEKTIGLANTVLTMGLFFFLFRVIGHKDITEDHQT